jgi:hypothetical protein
MTFLIVHSPSLLPPSVARTRPWVEPLQVAVIEIAYLSLFAEPA